MVANKQLLFAGPMALEPNRKTMLIKMDLWLMNYLDGSQFGSDVVVASYPVTIYELNSQVDPFKYQPILSSVDHADIVC